MRDCIREWNKTIIIRHVLQEILEVRTRVGIRSNTSGPALDPSSGRAEAVSGIKRVVEASEEF